MKAWTVYTVSNSGKRVRVTTVYTHDEGSEGEARDEARRTLDRPGRKDILRAWEESGAVVEPELGSVTPWQLRRDERRKS